MKMQGATSNGEALALSVVRRLQGASFIAYFAGGCVRDRLMGGEPKDFDVATSALPQEVLPLFPRSQQVGVAFGVVLVKERKSGRLEQVEVATFRADGAYSDGRHPDAVRFTTAQEDARRRDFTCNGLFFDPLAGVLHDFVGGQADIEAKILRAIGAPRERFGEDHLRLLRAVRFAARLGFEIEPATRVAMEELQEKISCISRERIGEEMRMMLEHPTRAAAAILLAGFGLMFRAVLGFDAGTQRLFATLANLPRQTRRAVALMAVMRDVGVDAAAMIGELRTRLVLSNEETEGLAWLAAKLPLLEEWEDLSKAATKRMMAHAWWQGLAALYRAESEHAEALLAFSERVAGLAGEGVAPAAYVTGDRLIKLGARPGPRFKSWLETLYDRQLEGEFADREAALAAARDLVAQAQGETHQGGPNQGSAG